MLQGFQTGFNIGSKASHFIVPTASAVAAAYGGYELSDYLMSANAVGVPENIKTIAEYGSGGIGALIGAGAGVVSKYTFVPQIVCGTVAGMIGASLEIGLYAVAIPIGGTVEGVKAIQKWKSKSKE